MDNEIALARASKLLKGYRDEIESLIDTARENSKDHSTIRTDLNLNTLETDTELVAATNELLQKLKNVNPEPEESRKYTHEEDAMLHPAIQEIRYLY